MDAPSTSLLELYNADGQLLATGNSTQASIGVVIDSFLVPEDGDYFVRVRSSDDYLLIVTVNAVLDAGINDSFATAQRIGSRDDVLGSIESTYTAIGPQSYSDARSTADSLGAHLATITDPLEQRLINEQFPSNAHWIGLADDVEEARFEWVTGEPLEFTNWRLQQPDNRSGIQHFAVNVDGVWDDRAGTDINPAILEFADRDFYEINLSDGDQLELVSSTPSIGLPSNQLDLTIRLYDSSQTLVAEDDNLATDEGNARLDYEVADDKAGLYFIEVIASGLPGTGPARWNTFWTSTLIRRPAVLFEPLLGVVTSEDGETATIQVSLSSPPTDEVSFGLSISDLSEGSIDKDTLEFSPDDWNLPQIVTVTGVDDGLADGPIPYSILTSPVASADARYDGIDPPDVAITNFDNEPPVVVYLSLVANDIGNALGLSGTQASNEDIVSFDGSGFSLFFDGSDVGLANQRIDAIAVLSDTEILMSFDEPTAIIGINGTVDDSDIVRFTASQTGAQTSGQFELYFDGSDVGLNNSGEDVDAIDLLDDGRLLVSTLGSASVPGVSSSDEDVLAFTPDLLGTTTAGAWSLYFDGSDVGLANSSNEDPNALSVDRAGKIHLSTLGDFAVSSVVGANEDVFAFTPQSLGTATAGAYDLALYFDGSVSGLGGNAVGAIDLPPPLINNAPVAVDDEFEIDEDSVLTVSAPGVLATDTDFDGDPLRAVVSRLPTNGDLMLHPDGALTYVPNENFNGLDLFSYFANDGTDESLTAATVSITVRPTNDAPTANSQSVSTNQDTPVGVSFIAFDVDGDTLTYSIIEAPSNGSLSGVAPNLTYTPKPRFQRS